MRVWRGIARPKGPLDGVIPDVAQPGTQMQLLMIAADLQATVQKRLSMFVMRAKAKLADATPALTAVIGFAGDVRDALSHRLRCHCPTACT